MEKKLLSINEAIEVLGVSRATFNKIRKENKFSEVTVGKRVRFDKDELLLVLKKASEAVADKKKVAVQYPSAIQQQNEKVILNIFSEQTLQEIEVHENVFDITLLEQIDPYAAVSMLCEFYGRTRMGAKIKLLVNEGVACQDLRSMQFFYYVESLCKQNVIWDNQVFTGKSVDDTSLLLPITSIKATGAERLVAEKLIGFMKRQGFKEDIGRAIAHIIGELADNSMTHSAEALSDRMCFISAERTLYREKNCIVVGLADPGHGIHTVLKTNKKYQALSEKAALVEAFRPYVTSWDSARGKGLTDVFAIAWGNSSYLRVDSNSLSLLMDFHEKINPLLSFNKPLVSAPGTRFGLILIDNSFERYSRTDVDNLLITKREELE